MLDLVSYRLEQVGIVCVRLEGSMSVEQRERHIEAFSNDPRVKVRLNARHVLCLLQPSKLVW